MKNQLSSPFTAPYAAPDPDGDRRDVHDHNPSTNLNVEHERGKGDPAMDFLEGMPGNKGRVGRVVDISPDILSTAMGGQRRSATGEYESEPSIHRTQQQEIDEINERMNSKVPTPWPRHLPGRE